MCCCMDCSLVLRPRVHDETQQSPLIWELIADIPTRFASTATIDWDNTVYQHLFCFYMIQYLLEIAANLCKYWDKGKSVVSWSSAHTKQSIEVYQPGHRGEVHSFEHQNGLANRWSLEPVCACVCWHRELGCINAWELAISWNCRHNLHWKSETICKFPLIMQLLYGLK